MTDDWTKEELVTAYPEGSTVPCGDGSSREVHNPEWAIWIALNVGMPKWPEAG